MINRELFLRKITLGELVLIIVSLCQIFIFITGGIVGYRRLEWRITVSELSIDAIQKNQEDNVRIHTELQRAVTTLTALEQARERDEDRRIFPRSDGKKPAGN